MKNDWSHILAYKLPAKKHEYNFMTVKVTLPGKKIGFTITIQSWALLKFIYSEKATKFWEIYITGTT